jgi:hypothetical protein
MLTSQNLYRDEKTISDAKIETFFNISKLKGKKYNIIVNLSALKKSQKSYIELNRIPFSSKTIFLFL